MDVQEKVEAQDARGFSKEDDEFWNELGRKEITPKAPITCEKGRHIFKQIGSREAKCITCPLGYMLSPGMIVMDGHIYKDDDFVI